VAHENEPALKRAARRGIERLRSVYPRSLDLPGAVRRFCREDQGRKRHWSMVPQHESELAGSLEELPERVIGISNLEIKAVLAAEVKR